MKSIFSATGRSFAVPLVALKALRFDRSKAGSQQSSELPRFK